MQYFKPSDIVTVPCTIQNITRAGAAFATAADGEVVFIPIRFVESSKLDSGDAVTCYCLDQSLDENRHEKAHLARYRAVRVRVEQRLSDVLPGSALPELMAQKVEVKPVESISPDEIASMAKGVFYRSGVVWSITDVMREVSKRAGGRALPSSAVNDITRALSEAHRSGDVAVCEVRRRADDLPSTYYAESDEVITRLLTEFELGD
jgi:hypothetical protein